MLSPLLNKLHTYKKSEEDEANSNKTNRYDDTHPNAVNLSHFDTDEERHIDGDYRMLEGYTQRTRHTHGHFTDLGNIKDSQVISARISDQNSLLAAGNKSVQATARM